MKNVIIVESPSKSHTIGTYVGSDYEVVSSKGHIRDLTTRGKGGLGVDIDNGFIPDYSNIKEKEELIADLKKICKGKRVFLATDPDREGEAISWHLAQVLNLDLEDNNRIVFNEITKKAVLDALNHSRKVDMNLVNSQEARRIIDRIIGFKLSYLLKSKIKSESAGRVQSASLKLIVDLEKEILAFIPEEHWKISADFDGFKAMLDTVDGKKIDGKKIRIENEKQANDIINRLGTDYLISEVLKKKTTRNSQPPYITSTLQQEAFNKLNFQSAKTMQIAQRLYEGINIGSETVGLITYMRTDSDRLSDEFIISAKQYIINNYGLNYVGNPKHKNTVLSQDAHEAIRPTSVDRTPDSIKNYLTNDEYKLYSLIYTKALASLMAPAIYNQTNVTLANNGITFKAEATELEFDGCTKVFKYNEAEKTLPPLNKDDLLKAKKVNKEQTFSKPKPRFTEATLISKMENLGIGRPSTYAQTIQTLKKRQYVTVKEKHLYPTEQGILTVDALDKHFGDVINYQYTARLETKLDNIAQGENKWDKVVEEAYNAFINDYEKAWDEMEKVKPKETGNICPVCGSPLVMRKSRFGEFEACSNYPNCKYIKNEKPEKVEVKKGIVCPKCGVGHIVERESKKGRSKGKIFFACDRFPKCKTAYPYEPTTFLCPKCKSHMMTTPKGLICSNEKCEDYRKI